LDWIGNDGTTAVPPNKSRVVLAYENKEHMSSVLRAHMQGGIGCDLATSNVGIAGVLHEWI